MDPLEFAGAKSEVKGRLDKLRREMDGYLAGEHGIKEGDKSRLRQWRVSHQPFHWFVEFCAITHKGGFDAAIGDRPYVEIR